MRPVVNVPPTHRATYRDVIDAPPHRVAEVVAGRLHVSPRPGSLAALAKTRLGAMLGQAFDRGRDGSGGWRIFHEPELHFGEDVLVPDVLELPLGPAISWVWRFRCSCARLRVP